MGMSASQARYLTLTGRKSDMEFEAQQIANARITLARESEALATEYNTMMNNRRLFFQKDGTNFGEMRTLPRLTYEIITASLQDGGLNMRLVNEAGKIIAPFVPEGKNPEDYEVDLNVLLPDYLEKNLRDGNLIMQQMNINPENGNGTWVNTSWQGNANIVDDLDKSDDTAAQATYDVRSSFIKTQDKKLEMRLTEISTEQKSLEQEMDAVKKVIDKNVESTFKTFA